MRDTGECAVGGESYPYDAEVPAAEEAGGMRNVAETDQGNVLSASVSADAAVATDVTTMCERCENAANAVNDAESDSLDCYVTVMEADRTSAAKLDVGPAGSCFEPNSTIRTDDSYYVRSNLLLPIITTTLPTDGDADSVGVALLSSVAAAPLSGAGSGLANSMLVPEGGAVDTAERGPIMLGTATSVWLADDASSCAAPEISPTLSSGETDAADQRCDSIMAPATDMAKAVDALQCRLEGYERRAADARAATASETCADSELQLDAVRGVHNVSAQGDCQLTVEGSHDDATSDSSEEGANVAHVTLLSNDVLECSGTYFAAIDCSRAFHQMPLRGELAEMELLAEGTVERGGDVMYTAQHKSEERREHSDDGSLAVRDDAVPEGSTGQHKSEERREHSEDGFSCQQWRRTEGSIGQHQSEEEANIAYAALLVDAVDQGGDVRCDEGGVVIKLSGGSSLSLVAAEQCGLACAAARCDLSYIGIVVSQTVPLSDMGLNGAIG